MSRITHGTLRRRRWLLVILGSATAAVLLAGVSAYAYFASGGSGTGSASAATVSNVIISQVTPVPTLTNQLYPGASGDIALIVSNPNAFPVTITGITTPATYAVGYSSSNLTGPIAGCSNSNTGGNAYSLVSWVGTSGAHTLVTPLTVPAASGGNAGSLSVTLVKEATMTTNAPAACEGAYFQMPSLTAIAATGYAATATSSPVSDTYN
jgi:hypothetical protein